MDEVCSSSNAIDSLFEEKAETDIPKRVNTRNIEIRFVLHAVSILNTAAFNSINIKRRL